MEILALHGFTGCGDDFAPLAALSPFRWHCPDLPGHGQMHAAKCTPDAIADWVNTEAHSIQSPKILLGYSMGARAALLHAVQHPKMWAALILISGNPGIEDEITRQKRQASDQALAAKIESEGVRAFIDFWQQQALIQSQANIQPEWRSAMRGNRLKHTPAGLVSSICDFGQGQFPNLWPKLKQLKMPILLITGTNDTKYTDISTRIAQHLPATEQISIQNTGHSPHFEAPSQTLEILDSFIKKHTLGDTPA